MRCFATAHDTHEGGPVPPQGPSLRQKNRSPQLFCKRLDRYTIALEINLPLIAAETKADAEAAFDFFIVAYGPKYDKASACLAKDRDCLLTFYDFPAEHWKHLRSTNPIESTFATVRLRTTKTKGCLSRKTALAMVFKQMCR